MPGKLYYEQFDSPYQLTKFLNDNSGDYIKEEVTILFNSSENVYVLFYRKTRKQ